MGQSVLKLPHKAKLFSTCYHNATNREEGRKPSYSRNGVKANFSQSPTKVRRVQPGKRLTMYLMTASKCRCMQYAELSAHTSLRIGFVKKELQLWTDSLFTTVLTFSVFMAQQVGDEYYIKDSMVRDKV